MSTLIHLILSSGLLLWSSHNHRYRHSVHQSFLMPKSHQTALFFVPVNCCGSTEVGSHMVFPPYIVLEPIVLVDGHSIFMQQMGFVQTAGSIHNSGGCTIYSSHLFSRLSIVFFPTVSQLGSLSLDPCFRFPNSLSGFWDCGWTTTANRVSSEPSPECSLTGLSLLSSSDSLSSFTGVW